MKKILNFKKDTDRQSLTKGQSLVEFALVLPILIVLILGMIEFGWILNGKITLTSAAREGARFRAVSKNATDTEVTGVVKRTTINSSLNDPSVHTTVDIEEDDVNKISYVKVTVTGSIDPIVGLFFNGSVNMESIAIMRLE